MTDLERILMLWRELQSAGADYVLASVVGVERPSYRKPGAMMIVSADGRRAGMVSGGCLEAEVARQAWWLTASGPAVQRYSTADEDGDRPYGSGCGGSIFLLLERSATAGVLLDAIDRAFVSRIAFAVATVLEGPLKGMRAAAGIEMSGPRNEQLRSLAETARNRGRSMEATIEIEGTAARVWCQLRSARPGLWIFGAGDDAQPLVRLARELGWMVAVGDGRSHLATRERFPHADAVRVLAVESRSGACPHLLGPILPHDAVVAMSHSFEQDARVLAALLGGGVQASYVGVLGPRRRTRQLLAEAVSLAGVPPQRAEEQLEAWLAILHAPTGLDLGAETPETVALSVVAEIQKVLAGATALPMREIRASHSPAPGAGSGAP